MRHTRQNFISYTMKETLKALLHRVECVFMFCVCLMKKICGLATFCRKQYELYYNIQNDI